MAIPVLALGFRAADGKQITLRYPYVRDDVTDEEVSGVMDTIIDNKDIYKTPPITKLWAKSVVETEDVIYDASEE
jgi:hypothetical protein